MQLECSPYVLQVVFVLTYSLNNSGAVTGSSLYRCVVWCVCVCVHMYYHLKLLNLKFHITHLWDTIRPSGVIVTQQVIHNNRSQLISSLNQTHVISGLCLLWSIITSYIATSEVHVNRLYPCVTINGGDVLRVHTRIIISLYTVLEKTSLHAPLVSLVLLSYIRLWYLQNVY